MSEAEPKSEAPGADDKALRALKKEFRRLKERSNELRDTIKSSIEERRALMEQINAMAKELGLEKKAADKPAAD